MFESSNMLLIKQCITYIIYLHGKAYIMHAVIAQNAKISRIQNIRAGVRSTS